MSIELRDVLSLTRKIRGNDRDSGTHYLLGYLWASTSQKEQEKIFALFTKDLMEQEKNK